MNVSSISFLKFNIYGVDKWNLFYFFMGCYFIYYSFGVLENIKIKVKALDAIYGGKALYSDYLATKGENQ